MPPFRRGKREGRGGQALGGWNLSALATALLLAGSALALITYGFAHGSCALPFWVLEVSEGKSGALLLRTSVRPGDRLTLAYRHSVTRSPVSGLFVINRWCRLVAEETRFSAFGPGLPELTRGDRYVVEGGTIRQRDIGQELEELSFFVHPFTEHVLTVRDHELALSATLPAGSLVKVRARWSPLPSRPRPTP